MKVKDLILRLQACNPDNVVVINGYEGGVTELKSVRWIAGLPTKKTLTGASTPAGSSPRKRVILRSRET